jgi:hypothetical protein
MCPKKGNIMPELTFTTTLAELDASVLEKLKDLFTGQAIFQIHISNVPDETAYLLSTQSNRESLKRSLEQFKAADFVQKTEEELGIAWSNLPKKPGNTTYYLSRWTGDLVRHLLQISLWRIKWRLILLNYFRADKSVSENMDKISRPYQDELLKALSNPIEAAAYLNAALDEGSSELFVLALQRDFWNSF